MLGTFLVVVQGTMLFFLGTILATLACQLRELDPQSTLICEG